MSSSVASSSPSPQARLGSASTRLSLEPASLPSQPPVASRGQSKLLHSRAAAST